MRPQPDTRDDALWRPGARRTILTRECDHHQALRACSSRKAVVAPADRRMLSTTATAVLASVDDNSAELIVVWPGRFHHACLRPKSTAVPAVHGVPACRWEVLSWRATARGGLVNSLRIWLVGFGAVGRWLAGVLDGQGGRIACRV